MAEERTNKQAPMNIVMADDHPIVRHGLRQVIESAPDLRIVAEVSDGAAALDAIETHRPSIALLDIDMPVLDGFAVAREVRRREIDVGIIMLTMHNQPDLFDFAMELNVDGYVIKESAIDEIVAAIKAVAAGRKFVSQDLASLMLDYRRRRDEFRASKPGLNGLTPTERRILRLIADDRTSKEIADELFVSRRTVEAHRLNIARKLELKGTLALVRFAAAHKSEI